MTPILLFDGLSAADDALRLVVNQINPSDWLVVYLTRQSRAPGCSAIVLISLTTSLEEMIQIITLRVLASVQEVRGSGRVPVGFPMQF